MSGLRFGPYEAQARNASSQICRVRSTSSSVWAIEIYTFSFGMSSRPRLRERSVFDRFEALGLQFMGPQYPSGRRAAQPPHGLPSDSRNVPTYHTRSRCPATAEHQLDYVFASRGFHESVTVRALNSVKDWGASDHCRLQIDVA